MIARLVGNLARKSTEALVVDVHGVGYQVHVSLNAFAALPEEGEPVELAIHTQLRENALELFGFVDPEEKLLFSALLTVSGVGPRMALNILSGIPTAELLDALAEGNVARLVAVPGIGKKTADRLVVELRDRAQALRARGRAVAAGKARIGVEDEAVSALENLGYRHADAERVVREVAGRGVTDLADLIREALRRLSS
jgi:Holliday junction DNA helicase RuvA